MYALRTLAPLLPLDTLPAFPSSFSHGDGYRLNGMQPIWHPAFHMRQIVQVPGTIANKNSPPPSHSLILSEALLLNVWQLACHGHGVETCDGLNSLNLRLPVGTCAPIHWANCLERQKHCERMSPDNKGVRSPLSSLTITDRYPQSSALTMQNFVNTRLHSYTVCDIPYVTYRRLVARQSSWRR